MKSKKLITLALCAAMLLSSLAACGSSDSGNAGLQDTTALGDNAETTAAAEEDPLALRRAVSDDLPDMDFEGAQFRIVADDDQYEHYFVEAETGDVIDDAVYARNFAVEDRFNVEIVLANNSGYDTNGKWMEKSVMAGDDSFDLAAHHLVNAGALAAKSLFLNWNDIPYINFEKPWWASSTTENLTYKGVTLIAIGDLALTSIGRTYCVFFDKVAAESYGIGDVYGIVNDGKWTIDKLTEVTKDVYTDVNGNDTRDFDDFYGFSSGSASNVGVYLWVFDNPIIKTDSYGDMYVAVKTEKINSIVEKLCALMYENPGTYYDKAYVSKYTGTEGQGAGHNTSRDMFIDSNVIFANGYVDQAIDFFRDKENDYGIIPYPKWDENQENYITMADGNHASLLIPKTASNLDKVGIITEALNAESYKSLVPAYYETALKVKYARDEESVEVLDMLINSRIFDFGYVYDAWAGCAFYLEGLVQRQDTGFESYYAKNENKVEKHYQDVFEVFEEYVNA